MTNYCTSILFSILKSITCVGFFRKKNLISLTEGLLCNSRDQPSYSWGIDWEASWMETLFNGPLWGQFECSWQFVGMSVDARHLVFFCQAKLVPLSLQLVNRAFRIGCQFCTCGIWLPKCTKSPQKAKQRRRSTNSGPLCVLWKLLQNTAEVEQKAATTSSSPKQGSPSRHPSCLLLLVSSARALLGRVAGLQHLLLVHLYLSKFQLSVWAPLFLSSAVSILLPEYCVFVEIVTVGIIHYNPIWVFGRF